MRLFFQCVAFAFTFQLSQSFPVTKSRPYAFAPSRSCNYETKFRDVQVYMGRGANSPPLVVIPKNYNISIGAITLGVLVATLAHNLAIGGLFGLIGFFLFIQTGKVRFVFDDQALEVLIAKSSSGNNGKTEEQLEQSRENFAVGGRNRWNYSTVKDWFFIPSRSFPVLMYFKEVQTPGSTDNGKNGQLHLFPVIMDAQLLEQQMAERVGPASR